MCQKESEKFTYLYWLISAPSNRKDEVFKGKQSQRKLDCGRSKNSVWYISQFNNLLFEQELEQKESCVLKYIRDIVWNTKVKLDLNN